MTIYGKAPFTYTDKMVEVSKSLRGNSRYSTAKNVFDWMRENIRYNNYAKGILRSIFLNYDYKSAHQVFRAGEGICLDQSYLYCVLARYAGISSNVVEVTKDCNGEKVWHACCSVDTGNERLLVDSVYSRLDAKHENYSIMSEEEVRNEYKSLRHCYEDDGCVVEKFVDKPNFKDDVSFVTPVLTENNIKFNNLSLEYLNLLKPKVDYLEYLRKEWKEKYNGIIKNPNEDY